jgi:serine protease Do
MKKFLFLAIILIIFAGVAEKLNLFTNQSNNSAPIVRQVTPSPITTNLTNSTNSTDHPYIGIRYKMIDQQTAQANGIAEGAYITQVVDNSPASKSGLIEEDIIIEFDGAKVNTSDLQSLTRLVSEKTAGEKIDLKIWRNKEIIDTFVTLEIAK